MGWRAGEVLPFSQEQWLEQASTSDEDTDGKLNGPQKLMPSKVGTLGTFAGILGNAPAECLVFA